MASTSNVIESLKYGYGVDRVLYMFNQESTTWNRLSKQKKPVAGRGQFLMPLMLRNAGAVSGIIEGGALPSALQPDTAEASFSLQEYVAVYDISWKLIQDARSSKFAFKQAVQLCDESLRRRFMRMLNADLIDDGRGRLAVWTAADNSTPVTSAFLPRVEAGMVVDCMDTDNDTKNGDSLTITGVDPQARTFAFSGSVSSTGAGDYLVIQDTTDDSINDSLHTNGLLGVIDDGNPASIVGNYGGVDRTTAGNEFAKAVVLDNGGTNRPLTEDLLLQAMDYSREKGSGGISFWLSNLALPRRYHEILASERFFALSRPGTLSGGIGREAYGDNGPEGKGETPYEFSGIPWAVDPYFANNTLVGVDTDHVFLGVGENDVPRPISEIFDNIPFFRQTANATFEVAWYYQLELISDNLGSSCVKIEDLAEL